LFDSKNNSVGFKSSKYIGEIYFEEFSLNKFGKSKKYYEYLHKKKIITL